MGPFEKKDAVFEVPVVQAENETLEQVLGQSPGRFAALGKAALILAIVGMAGATAGRTIHEQVAPVVAEAREIAHDFSAAGTIDLDADTSYTFIGAGDSLAAGMGDDEKTTVDGQPVPKSFIEPVVSLLNEQKKGIAAYRYDTELVRPGMSLSELTERLQGDTNELAAVPNLILVVSAEFNTFHETADDMIDVQEDRPPEGLLEKAVTARDMVLSAWESLSDHDRHIREFQAAIAGIQAERDKRLKRGNDMTIVFLALPNTTKTPAVHDEIERRGVAVQDIERLQMFYNLASRRAINRADRESRPRGTRYVFVDPFSRSVDVSRDVSADGFHPNAHGYNKIAMLVAEQARIISNRGMITFMPGPQGVDAVQVGRR